MTKDEAGAFPPGSTQPHPRHSQHPAGGLPGGGWSCPEASGRAGPQVPLLSELPSGLSRRLVGTRSCCGERRGAVSPPVLWAQLSASVPEAGAMAPVAITHPPPFLLPLEERLDPFVDQEAEAEKGGGVRVGTQPLRALTCRPSHICPSSTPHTQPLRSCYSSNASPRTGRGEGTRPAPGLGWDSACARDSWALRTLPGTGWSVCV